METLNVDGWHNILDELLKAELKNTEIEQVHDFRKGNKGKNVLGNKSSNKSLILNIIDNHYFLETRMPITKSYVIHKLLYNENIPSTLQTKTFEKGRGWRTNNRDKSFMMSGDLIRLIMCVDKVYNKLLHMIDEQLDDEFNETYIIKYNDKYYRLCNECGYEPGKICFEPMKWSDYGLIETKFHKELKDDELTSLDYDKEHCCRLIQNRKFKNDEVKVKPSYWYADFESDVSGEIHKPFMVCIQPSSGVKSKTKTFIGEDCAKQLMDYLPDGSIVYFHNLAYDFRMMVDVGDVQNMLQKGTRIMNGVKKYNNKTLKFRDSLSILNFKLSKLPGMFHLEDEIKKELFPYKYYTLERLRDNKGIISECGKDEDKVWDDDDMKTFIKNIDSIPGCRIDENTFDMYKYAEFYCQQDVKVLRLCLVVIPNLKLLSPGWNSSLMY